MASPLTNFSIVDRIISSLYQLPNKVQFCHHSTKSYAAHKALDKAYDAIQDLKDSIVEQLIGYSNQRPVTVTLEPLSGYSESMNMQVAEEIMAFGARLKNFASQQGYENIENLAQEYSGAGAQLKYLLTLS